MNPHLREDVEGCWRRKLIEQSGGGQRQWDVTVLTLDALIEGE